MEEIRALPRQTFGLAAASMALAATAPLVALAARGPTALRDYLIFAWIIAQLVVAIVLAGRIARARQTRLVDGLFTMPLEQRTWLLAEALVGVFLSLVVIAAQLPILSIHVLHVGMPPALLSLVLAAFGVAATSVALGLFCGFVVGSAGPGAASGCAGGIGAAFFGLFFAHGVALSMAPSATRELLLRMTALSPLTLGLEAFGIIVFRGAPAEAWRPLAGLGGLFVGLLLAASVACVFAQSPLGWEARRARVVVPFLVGLAVAAPLATAAVEYVEAPSASREHIMSPGEHTRVAFVAPGEPITDDAFTARAYLDWDPLPVGQERALDVLVMIEVGEGAPGAVQIDVAGTTTLRVLAGGAARFDGEPAGYARISTGSELTAAPQGTARPVYRVPVIVMATNATTLLGSPSLMTIHVIFELGSAPQRSEGLVSLPADIPHASAQLALAALALPVAGVLAAIARKIQTR